MARVIYLCPADNRPTGGIKVIYRHAEILAAMAVEAYVLHPFDTTFRCSWFDHDARLLDSLALHPHSDFVIIPELWAPIFAPQCRQAGVRHAIFVQNGYLTHPVLPDQDARAYAEAYRRADLVLAISDDSAVVTRLNYPEVDPARILRVNYSVDPRFAASTPLAARERAITYMPRKMASHAARVTAALVGRLPPGWRIEAIDGVDEGTCAAMLSRSSVFLAFSDFEGLPLPPMEAALAGNLVVGYTGQGAREYWEAPLFTEIHQGDIVAFVTAAASAARDVDAARWPDGRLEAARSRLAERYSAAAERATLAAMMGCVDRALQTDVAA